MSIKSNLVIPSVVAIKNFVDQEQLEDSLKKLAGYGTTGTKILKCIDGVIQWVDE